jgi:hypothetical protein
MKEFVAAARSAVEDEEYEGKEPKPLEFGLAGQDFRAKVPTTGQVALVAGSFGGRNSEMVSAIFEFLQGVLLDDGYRRLRALVADGTVPFEVIFGGDDNNEQGIVEWISSKAAGRPTKQPTDFSKSQKSGGQRSTGRSPGKGSIPST